MKGSLKITKIKQSISGNNEETFLGELGLLDVSDGSVNIYIGYEVKKGLILEMLITSEEIIIKMVKHVPIKYSKISDLCYLFLNKEKSSNKMIIGSHVGVNNYNQDNLKQILFNLNCHPFSGIRRGLGEKYLLEVNNQNNNVTIQFDSDGLEINFYKPPVMYVEEVFGIFKEDLFNFSLIENKVIPKKIEQSNYVYENNEVDNWNKVGNWNEKEISQEEKPSLIINISKYILFLFFLSLLLIWSINFFSR